MLLKKKLFWILGIVAFLLSGVTFSQESTPNKEATSFHELLINALLDDDVAVFKKYPEIKADSGTFIGSSLFKKNGEALPITVLALDKAYNQNEIKADLQYKDKLLLVSGKISSIDKSFGSPVLQLRTNNPYLSANAFFKKSKNNELELALAEFKKGQSVNLLCTGAGKMMVPVLRNCELVDAVADAEKEEMRKELLDALEGKGDKQKNALMVFILLYGEEQLGPQGQAACAKSKANCLKLYSKALAKLDKTKKENFQPPQTFLDLGYTMDMLKASMEKEETPSK